MAFIVEGLHFESHSRVAALDHFLSHKILDATVSYGAAKVFLARLQS
jgi:hypothetical protein